MRVAHDSIAIGRLLVATCALLSGEAVAASQKDAAACLASNLPERSAKMAVRLESKDRSARTYVHEARIYWKQLADGSSKTLVCMTAPRDTRGLTYLVHEDESGHTLWVYLPEEERIVRINPGAAANRGHIARTAISYEDIRYLPVNLTKAVAEQALGSTIGDRPVSVVQLSLPAGKGSLYNRVTSFLDPESCVPLKINFYEAENRLRKIATANVDTIQRENRIWLARSIRIQDLKRAVETELTVEEVEIDGELSDRMFDPQSQKGRCPK
jgi:hypothetical protein